MSLATVPSSPSTLLPSSSGFNQPLFNPISREIKTESFSKIKNTLIEKGSSHFNKYFIASTVALVASAIFWFYQFFFNPQNEGFYADFALIATGLVAAGCYALRKKKIEKITQQLDQKIKEIRDEIIANQKTQTTFEERQTSRDTKANQILGQLFLGNEKEFKESATKYQNVITVCPLEELEDHDKIDKQDILRKVTWINVGEGIENISGIWDRLILNCTFFNDKTKTNLPLASKWFEPLFEIFDRAVFEDKKTLVHCVEGDSRSAAVIAAYLIKRFAVSHQKAQGFLCQRRPCVDSNRFKDDLERYDQLLTLTTGGGLQLPSSTVS